MERNIILGQKGEALARKYLLAHGYELIATNYKSGYPEIDIIAKDKSSLIFVEVKTRIKTLESSHENPLLRWQTKTIKRAILDYAYKKSLDLEALRLDLIVILVDQKTKQAELKHYRDVF